MSGSPIPSCHHGISLMTSHMLCYAVLCWSPYRNAPHDSRFTHVPSLEGRAGFWDTIKGWGIGMCQVGDPASLAALGVQALGL